MKNQTKNFIEFEGVARDVMPNNCEDPFTILYLGESPGWAMSSRRNTPTPAVFPLFANLAITAFPSFECRVADNASFPFPVYGKKFYYQGIKSIRVDDEGFVLFSPDATRKIELTPGETLNNPFNGQEFYIGLKRQGAYSRVYLELNYEVEGGTTPPPMPDCIESGFFVDVVVYGDYEVETASTNPYYSASLTPYGKAYEGPID